MLESFLIASGEVLAASIVVAVIYLFMARKFEGIGEQILSEAAYLISSGYQGNTLMGNELWH